MFPCVLRVRTLNAAALGNESVSTQETDRSSPADYPACRSACIRPTGLAREEARMKARAFLCLLLFASAAANAGASDVTGRWKATISLGDETMTGVALLKQTGDEVTGSIGPDDQNQHPLDGVVKGNQVTLTTHPRPGRTVAFDTCYLTVDGERMTGTTERKGSSDKGKIELVRSQQ